MYKIYRKYKESIELIDECKEYDIACYLYHKYRQEYGQEWQVWFSPV